MKNKLCPANRVFAEDQNPRNIIRGKAQRNHAYEKLFFSNFNFFKKITPQKALEKKNQKPCIKSVFMLNHAVKFLLKS